MVRDAPLAHPLPIGAAGLRSLGALRAGTTGRMCAAGSFGTFGTYSNVYLLFIQPQATAPWAAAAPWHMACTKGGGGLHAGFGHGPFACRRAKLGPHISICTSRSSTLPALQLPHCRVLDSIRAGCVTPSYKTQARHWCSWLLSCCCSCRGGGRRRQQPGV